MPTVGDDRAQDAEILFRFLRAVKDYERNASHAELLLLTLFKIAVFTGTRVEHLRRIQWRDVDFHTSRLTVPPRGRSPNKAVFTRRDRRDFGPKRHDRPRAVPGFKKRTSAEPIRLDDVPRRLMGQLESLRPREARGLVFVPPGQAELRPTRLMSQLAIAAGAPSLKSTNLHAFRSHFSVLHDQVFWKRATAPRSGSIKEMQALKDLMNEMLMTAQVISPKA